MKKIYLAAAFFLYYFTSSAQTKWQSAYGDTLSDAGRVIISTSDGGYCFTGPSGFSIPDSSDITIYRTDNLGQLLWSTKIGVPGDETPTGIAETSIGGFIITGTTKVSQFDTVHTEIFACCVNNSGGFVIWSKVFGGPQDDEANSILRTPTGFYIIMGSTKSYGSFVKSALALKINENGDQQWCRLSGAMAENYFTSGDMTTDGNYILGGGANDSTHFSNYIAKIDTNGGILWSERFGNGGANHVNCIRSTSDNGFIVAGISSVNTAGDTDQNITKLDSSGGITWSYNYGSANYDISNAVIETPSHNFVVCGYSVLTGTSGTLNELVMEEISGTGNIIWANIYGSTDYNSTGFSLTNGTDDGYAALGSSDAFGDPFGDVYFVKTDSAGVSGCFELADTLVRNTATLSIIPNSTDTILTLNEFPTSPADVNYTQQYIQNCFDDDVAGISKNNLLQLFPNPVKNTLHINSDFENAFVTVFDETGRKLLQQKINSSLSILDVSSLTPGFYFINLQSADRFLQKSFIKE